MTYDPKAITKEHVLKAVDKIENNGIPLKTPTRWLVEINGKLYPPKEIMRYAHEALTGEKNWKSNGGEPTNKFLKDLGFTIVPKYKESKNDPIKELITNYKNHIQKSKLADELYKWKHLAIDKGKPNLNEENLADELRSINYRNLMYPLSGGVIIHLAKDKPEQFRECLRNLFDENIPLIDRIKDYGENTLKIYRELNPDKKLSHHQDERTIATLLTFKYPEKYTFYKSSFYQAYCSFLNIKSESKGKKYIHYLELIDNLISEYIMDDQELINMANEFIPDDHYHNERHNILAQDILFKTFDQSLGQTKTYWRVGTNVDEIDYWSYMSDNDKICIGWSELGDLNEKNISSKKDVYNLLKEKDHEYELDRKTRSRKAGEIYNFYYTAKEGDIVLAQEGQKVLGLGVIIDEYEYNPNGGRSHQRMVDWKVKNPGIFNKEGLQTTFFPLKSKELILKINELLENKGNTENKSARITENLNQILFGPPGTGKTFNTISKAVSIINSVFDLKQPRKIIKKEYERLLNEGQIVFTTFHQSMSYEDFIEGIKPIEPEKDGDNVIYKILHGIFRRVCVNASFSFAQLRENKTTEGVLDFSIQYDNFLEDIEEKLLSGDKVFLETKSGNKVEVDSISTQGNVIIKHKEGLRTYTVSKERLSKLQAAINNLDEVSNINDHFRNIIGGSNSSAYWSVLNAIRKRKTPKNLRNTSRNFTYEEKKEAVLSLTNNDFKNSNSKPYVLIIDEINRGNVSQIFGELITLIEEDKRSGKPEALEVTLPYSKEKFSVPPNLYIIGTMNTADRSVEALDAALRRRFSFEEMLPLYDLEQIQYEYANTSASEILKTINGRIEKLTDKDHQIGHSYFFRKDDENAEATLMNAFYLKIIPLLQEYFFGDFGKIGLVLGEGFVKLKEWDNNSDGFADFAYESAEDFEKREIYEIIDYRKKKNYLLKRKNKDEITIDFENAIQLLMKQKID